MASRPVLIADAGYMYVAKMSGQASTPFINIMIFYHKNVEIQSENILSAEFHLG
jgi:hypothetical protein